ncbi:hypothetical protein EXW96_16925 [Paenibacillus sp. JMULE4]|nr:hypothetical protein [Paenibacillus sp. JMULE4]
MSRQTMANWMLHGAQWLTHVYERMKRRCKCCGSPDGLQIRNRTCGYTEPALGAR